MAELDNLVLMLCYSDKAGWSKGNDFRTPPEAGAFEVKVIMLSDMGKNERDSSNEHFLQVRNISCSRADVMLRSVCRTIFGM